MAGFKKAIPLSGGGEWAFARGGLGRIYAVLGKKSEALEVLDELKHLSGQEYVPATSLAIVYTGLGDKDQAFSGWKRRTRSARFSCNGSAWNQDGTVSVPTALRQSAKTYGPPH